MDLVELLIELEEKGFPMVFACEDEVVVIACRPDARLTPQLKHGLTIHKPELLPMLKKVTKEYVKELLEGRPPARPA